MIFDEVGRPEPPMDGDEAGILLGFLEFHRATLAWKCTGLDAIALRTPIPPSTMTLGGLLKHVAYVEDDWCHTILLGRACPEPWASVDWESDPDWDWNSAIDDSPGELTGQWHESVDRCRSLLAEAIATHGLDSLAARSMSDGGTPSLRWIVVHLIEEYSRHNGHADLIREAIDGSTGE